MFFKKDYLNKSHTNAFTTILFSILFSLTICLILFSVGCSVSQQTQSQEELIRSHVYPNEVAENAQVSQQYSDIADKLTEDNIKYFYDIAKIPHPSGHLENIKNFLLDEYRKLGFSPQIDIPSDSVYVDIPATSNYASSPKIILQAHMDMVPTVADPNSSINLEKQGVEVSYDEDTGEIKSKDGATNIGADDGVGMSLMLSLAKNATKFEHPAMRFLYTSDEEPGLIGASKLSASVLDADYLINYDWCRVGEVVVSSAGAFDAYITKNFSTVEPLSSDTAVDVKVTDLVGGHTADSAPAPRVHASNLALNCMKKLTENNIEYKVSYLKTGNVTNAFPTHLDMQFYVNSNQKEQAKSICEEYIKDTIDKASDDVNAKFVVSFGDSDDQHTYMPISVKDSQTLANTLCKIPDGVIKMSEINTSLAETSCAMGILNLDNGQLKASVKLRSSVNENIDYYKDVFSQYCSEAGLNYEAEEPFYAFPDSSDSSLTKAVIEGYKEVCGIDAATNICHGGLETSYFQVLKPNLKMICIGSDIKDEHMPTETYYTKSQSASTASLLYAITHLGN